MKAPRLTGTTRALLLIVFVVVAAALFLWRRASTPLDLDAPTPRVVADVPDSLPRARVSVVDAPVTYDLATAVDSLEAAIPRSYGDIETRLPIASNARASFAYSVRRSRFRVSVVGQTVSISADVEYAGRVWYRPIIGPELSASCGTGSDARPRAKVTLGSTGWLTPDWQLRTRTRVVRLEPYSEDARDRCRLTVLRIDVTDRVFDATREMLQKNLVRFDQSAARWPVRPRFERMWQQLQRPIRLTDGVYLAIYPYSAQLGGVGAEGKNVVAHLRLMAAPRILSGPTPSGAQFERPIPPLQRSDQVGTGANVQVSAAIAYPVASTMLRRAVNGRAFEQAGRTVRIRDVRLSGVGGGRVALDVRLAGAVRGHLYLTGTPSFDATNHQVYVPDLDYDVGTAQLLVAGFGWLKGVDIRDFLRARARLPGSAVMDKLRALAESGVNRTLAPGVVLSGRIDHVEGTSVRATTRELQLRAAAFAELKLAIDKPPPLPRLPRQPKP